MRVIAEHPLNIKLNEIVLSMMFSLHVRQAEEFLKDFNILPRWRLDDLMVSYASEGGGIGPHVDNYDVFLIQGHGLKSPRRTCLFA